MTAPAAFPAFIRAEYDRSSSGFPDFEAAAKGTLGRVRQQFDADFREIGNVITSAVTRGVSSSGKFDLGTGQFRQAAAEARLYEQTLRTTQRTAAALAAETGDTSEATRRYLQALNAQVIEAERVTQQADVQVATYTRLQTAIDHTADRNSRLSQTYRELYSEQAKAAQADVYARNFQDGINEANAPGLNRAPKSAAESAGVFAAATAQADRYAQAAAQVRAALDPMYEAQQRFDIEMTRAETLLAAGAITEREYTDEIKRARTALYDHAVAITNGADAAKRGTTAFGAITNSARAMRFAALQSGQQFQDIVVQLQAGTHYSTIFVQQFGQLAFAFSGIEGPAGSAAAKIGSVARFMSGVGGAAILAAVAIGGPLLTALLDGDKATDNLNKKSLTLSEALTKEKFATDQAREALAAYNDEKKRAAEQDLVSIMNTRESALQRLREALATRQQIQATIDKALVDEGAARGVGGGALLQVVTAGQDALNGPNGPNARIKELTTTITNLSNEIAEKSAEIATDPIKKIETVYDLAVKREEQFASAADRVNGSLDRRIAKIYELKEAALKAAREAEKKPSTRIPQGIDTPFAYPVSGGSVSSGFGLRNIRGHQEAHPGIDIAVPVGTAVRAPAAGTVDFAGLKGGYGNEITLNFGAGTQGLFGHLSEIVVKAGQVVKAGDVIGYSGGARGAEGAGNSTGPHLHYEIRRNGRPVDPRAGKFPTDPGAANSDADRIAKQQEEAAQRFVEKQKQAFAIVQRITGEFDDQPKLIDRATAASTSLVAIINEYKGKTDAASKAIVEGATKAKALADTAVPRAFDKYLDLQRQSLQVQTLIDQGRTVEADALQQIYQIEQQLGPLDEHRKQQVLALAQAREEEARASDIARQKQQKYLDAIQDVQENIRDTLAGARSDGLINSLGAFVKRLGSTFDKLAADYLTEKFFGPALRALEDQARGRSPFDEATGKLADGVDTTTTSLSNLAKSFDAASAAISASASHVHPDSPFGVAANDNAAETFSQAADTLFDVQKNAANVMDELRKVSLGKSDPVLGNKDPAKYLGDTLTTLLRSTGIKISDDSAQKIGGIIGSAVQGAAIGEMAGGLVLGKKGNKTGEQIGGAIGGALGKASGIPGADIVGSILGGIVGGLFHGVSKVGGAKITSVDQAATLSGNNAGAIKNATSLAGQVQDGLKRIADQLGGTIGAFSVSIGTFKDEFRVNPSGGAVGGVKGSGAVGFGDDAEAAVRYAILDALQDGAIQGLREGTKRLLQQGKDLDSALQNALDFEQVFKDLKARTDPVGAALDTVNAKFDHLREVFKDAGASAQELAQLEQLYGYERADAIKQASEQMTSALKSLMSDLTVGDNGRSLRDRLSAAHAAFDPLEADLNAGKKVDYDAFADAARNVLDLERQLGGSQSSYFDFLDRLTNETNQALTAQQKLIDDATGSNGGANDNAPVVSAIDGQTQTLIDALGGTLNAQLGAVNQNLGTLIGRFDNLDFSGGRIGKVANF